jgi:hypothetical protein
VVEEARLLPGDEVAIGHLIYRVENVAATPAPAPAPAPAPPPAKAPEPSLPQMPTYLDDDGDLVPLLD